MNSSTVKLRVYDLTERVREREREMVCVRESGLRISFMQIGVSAV